VLPGRPPGRAPHQRPSATLFQQGRLPGRIGRTLRRRSSRSSGLPARGSRSPGGRIVSRFSPIVTCRIRALDVIAIRARPDVISIRAPRMLSTGFEPGFLPPDPVGQLGRGYPNIPRLVTDMQEPRPRELLCWT
jgi:hypothetical protein